MRDEIFADEQSVKDFIFDEKVAGVFDDMLERSIPFYGEIQRMAVELSKATLDGKGGSVYDIGCSTGTTLIQLMSEIPADQDVRFVGVEPSPSMRAQFLRRVSERGFGHQVEAIEEPIECTTSLAKANVVLMLFALQFVRPPHRDLVLTKIYTSLEPGGILLLGEKVLSDHSSLARFYIDLYHEYKARMGYSYTEITRKREALENVLVPYRVSENREALENAGFACVDEVFRWYNFAVYMAVK